MGVNIQEAVYLLRRHFSTFIRWMQAVFVTINLKILKGGSGGCGMRWIELLGGHLQATTGISDPEGRIVEANPHSLGL